MSKTSFIFQEKFSDQLTKNEKPHKVTCYGGEDGDDGGDDDGGDDNGTESDDQGSPEPSYQQDDYSEDPS